ncbi:MAG: hypothetical protein ACJ8ER_11290 [Allosphingosinicella sp.]
MAGEKVDFDAAKASSGSDKSIERSTIGFPYYDLKAAEEVARAVYARAGISSCPLDELAAEMKVTMSGNFRLKNAAAKLFDLVDKDGVSAIKLSDNGLRLIDKSTEAEARTNAFLAVPLYSALYDLYRGKMLPPTKALEREICSLGVSVKQATKARQIFQSSAKYAGYFDSGEDRLVRPRVSGSGCGVMEQIERPEREESPGPPDEPVTRGRNGSGGAGRGGAYHPFVEGLLQTMPEPGTLWTIEGRAAWLEAAATMFKLIYKGDGKITVRAEPPQTNGNEASM